MKHQIPPRTVENKLIFRLRMAALEACKGNQAHAAFFCGVSIRSFSSFINDCRKAGVAIPKYDPTTRLIEQEENTALETLLNSVLKFPIGENSSTNYQYMTSELQSCRTENKFLRAELGDIARKTARYAKEKL